MQPTQTLPGHYQKIGTVDISKDKRLMLLFNFVGIIGLVISGWLFLQILVWLRPGDAEQVFSVESSSITQVVLFLGALLALVMFNTFLHEAIHGFFFLAVHALQASLCVSLDLCLRRRAGLVFAQKTILGDRFVSPGFDQPDRNPAVLVCPGWLAAVCLVCACDQCRGSRG